MDDVIQQYKHPKTDDKNLPIMDEFCRIGHSKMDDMNHPIMDGLELV